MNRKNLISITILVFICSMLFMLVPHMGSAENIDSLVSKGANAYKIENYKTAYGYFQQAMKINPNHTEASAWFWKMKAEHDVKNLKDKGPDTNTSTTDKDNNQDTGQKDANTHTVDKKTVSKKETTSGTGVKIVYVKDPDSGVYNRIRNLDKQLNSISKEIKNQSKVKEDPSIFKNTYALVIAGLIFVFMVVVVYFLVAIIRYKSKLHRVTAPQNVYGMYNAAGLNAGPAEASMRDTLSSDVEKKLIAIDVAKKLLNHSLADKEKINNLLTTLSLDSDDRVHEEAGRLSIGYNESGHTQEQAEANWYETENIMLGYGYILNKKHSWENSKEVYDLAKEIGIRLGFNQQQMKELAMSALLQNIGFLLVPEEILNKKGQLTKDELSEVLLHPAYSAEIAKAMFLPELVIASIKSHQERYNGSGYPEGLRGMQIPLYARIIGVCDSYVALVSERPFRESYSMDEALAILQKDTFLFDPDILNVFTEVTKLFKYSNLSKGKAKEKVVIINN